MMLDLRGCDTTSTKVKYGKMRSPVRLLFFQTDNDNISPAWKNHPQGHSNLAF